LARPSDAAMAEERPAKRDPDVMPNGRQALYLELRATNGPGWEDPGAVYVCGANAPAGRS
jgi:hypothetical protein